jgi:HSP20 family protein
MYTTYDVFSDLVGLRDMVDRFFNERSQTLKRSDYPFVNLYESNDTIEITSLLPGVKNDEVNIQLVGDTLVIEGDRKNDNGDKSYIRREREFGKFRKTVKLPYSVDSNRVEASLKDGVISIRLSKSEDAKPKKIEIR